MRNFTHLKLCIAVVDDNSNSIIKGSMECIVSDAQNPTWHHVRAIYN